MALTLEALRAELGDIDIYLLDQLMRGRLGPEDVVLDAGCGHGRNLAPLLRLGCQVVAVDRDRAAIDAVRRTARELAPRMRDDSFRVESVEDMTIPERAATVVVCSAVLHFARDDAHFEAMVGGLWSRLAPGGILFCRLATTIGAALVGVERIEPGRYRMPFGPEWYLASESQLLALTEELGGDLADPLKTTIVQDQRCMTTWVVRRRA